MAKVNVARKITCFYPGTIQLPLMKFYPIKDGEDTLSEWAVARNFQALNITDYRTQLESLSKEPSTENRIYSCNKENLVISYNVDGEQKALAEIINIREGSARNVDRFFFDAPFSELILFQYYYDAELLTEKDKEIIEVNFDETAKVFEEIVNLYITGANDWTISPPNAVYSLLYYEMFDIYFDTDIPKEEMRQAVLLKTDRHWDCYRAQVSLEQLDTSLNTRIILSREEAENNLFVTITDRQGIITKARELFAKIGRDIYINKNYKYAFLESFTFMESFVTKYITDYKIKRGISKTKIDNFEKEIGISYKINIELPLIIGVGEKEKDIISKVESIRKRRNKIIHGYEEIEKVKKEEAVNALNAVKSLFDLITSTKVE